jgi:hypothetical protein
MKKIQYSYLPADSAAAAGNARESKKENEAELSKTIPPPDEATVARLNAIGREYPFCAWYKPKHNTLL